MKVVYILFHFWFSCAEEFCCVSVALSSLRINLCSGTVPGHLYLSVRTDMTFMERINWYVLMVEREALCQSQHESLYLRRGRLIWLPIKVQVLVVPLLFHSAQGTRFRGHQGQACVLLVSFCSQLSSSPKCKTLQVGLLECWGDCFCF